MDEPLYFCYVIFDCDRKNPFISACRCSFFNYFDSLKSKAIHKKVYTPPRFSIHAANSVSNFEMFAFFNQTNTNDLQMLVYVYLTSYVSSALRDVLFYKHELRIKVRPKSVFVWRIVFDRKSERLRDFFLQIKV